VDAITAVMPLLQAGTAGAGLFGNIMNSIQQGNVASQAEKNAKLTPAQLGSQVASATQPLDRNLTNAINNQVQGDMASRGLAEAPGIFAATEGQALAPFQQAEQDRALQLVLAKLGLPASTLAALRSGGGGMANLSPLLQMIAKMFPQQTQQVPNTSDTPSPVPGIIWNIMQQNNPTMGQAPTQFGDLTTPNNFTGSTDTGATTG
jgi:hypothetical protein